jgi:sporulation protein YlmC with PRC-barrel domain
MQTHDRFYLRRLARLRTHRIAPGEPDIHGWLVLGVDGRRVGRVRDIIVDAKTFRTRYLDVTLDPDVAIAAGAPTAVVPVESLQVAAVRPHVNLRDVNTCEIENVPGFGTAPIGLDEDMRLRQFFRCEDRPMSAEEFWRPRRRERASQPYVAATRAR